MARATAPKQPPPKRLALQSAGKYDHAEVQELTLAPLPCWADRTEAERQEAVAAMVWEIETETKERLRREGRSPMGAARIQKQSTHDAPQNPSRSPAPRFHAATGTMRKSLEYQFREFRHWYRAAAEALRDGCKNVEFPPDCFPPGRPFYARGDPPLNFVPGSGG